jgi:hypothetical protein
MDDLLRLGVFVNSINGKQRLRLSQNGRDRRNEPWGALIIVDDCTRGFFEVCELLKVILGVEGCDELDKAAKRWGNVFVLRSRHPKGHLLSASNGLFWHALGKVLGRMAMNGMIWREHASPEYLVELFSHSDLDQQKNIVLKGIVITSAVSFHEQGSYFKQGFQNSGLRDRINEIARQKDIPLILADYLTLEFPPQSPHGLKDFTTIWPYLLPPTSWEACMKTLIDQLVASIIRLQSTLHRSHGKQCVKLVYRTFNGTYARHWAKYAIKAEIYSVKHCEIQQAKHPQTLYSIYTNTLLPIDFLLDSLCGILLDAGRDTDALIAAPVVLENSTQNTPSVRLTAAGSNVYLLLSRNSSETRQNHHRWWKSFALSTYIAKPGLPSIARAPAETWMDVVKGLSASLADIAVHPDTMSWPELEREYIRRARENLADGAMTRVARRSLDT